MTRISILRLKPITCSVQIYAFVVAINDKNLNSEIETVRHAPGYVTGTGLSMTRISILRLKRQYRRHRVAR